MDKNLSQIEAQVYNKCGLEISDLKIEVESKEYNASRFELNGLKIIYRNAKITPKKNGQFVTFWKRKNNQPIEPFNESDQIDFYVINVRAKDKFGQFVFPKSVLIKRGIISSENKEGKRGFRVYPGWDTTASKQAGKTQKWQLNYFYEIGERTDLIKVTELYKQKYTEK